MRTAGAFTLQSTSSKAFCNALSQSRDVNGKVIELVCTQGSLQTDNLSMNLCQLLFTTLPRQV